MNLMFDTADVAAIRKYNEIFPIVGVTTNPSIIKKVGEIDFFERLREIRRIIGKNKSLHAQVVAQDYEGILKDAKTIVKEVDESVFIKIPVTENGLKAIKTLKKENYNVTATAIYSKFQAYMALACGADYVAPYFNRMENLGIDSGKTINEIAKEIERSYYPTQILAASFKNIGQVNQAIEAGAHVITIDPSLLSAGLSLPSVQKAVDDFQKDWESLYGENQTVNSLL